MQPAVDVRGLRYRYPDGTVALNGIDFTLADGEACAVLGPNGSGKTTFILHLNGLLMGEGAISIGGVVLTKSSLPAIRRRVGLVFQDSDDQLFMPSVLEDVLFGVVNLGISAEEAVTKSRAALDLVGMRWAENKAPYHLSAGEKKRVALAGVLAMEPEILVLDEPTTYLDPPGQRELASILLGLSQAKLLVTHDIPFARKLCGRAVFFEKGRIAGDGEMEGILKEFSWGEG